MSGFKGAMSPFLVLLSKPQKHIYISKKLKVMVKKNKKNVTCCVF